MDTQSFSPANTKQSQCDIQISVYNECITTLLTSIDQIITEVCFFYSFEPEFNTMHLPDFSIPKFTHDKSQEPLFGTKEVTVMKTMT